MTIDELERDPHGVFRRYRRQFPFIKRADGTALVLRDSDVQQLFTDPRTRQSENEFFELRGIQEAPLFDLFKYSMVTSNGSDHRRRRSAFSTAFAFCAMTDLRLYIRKVADELIDSFYAEASQLPACLIGHILSMPREYPFFHRARVLNDPSL